MTNLVLKGKERSGLEQIVASVQDVRVLNRAYALLWLASGDTVPEVAEQLQVSPRSVYHWLERFRERASQPLLERLADGLRSGRPCTAQGIIEPLIEEVIERDPRALGFRATVWTAPLLVSYLERQHQLGVSCQSVRLALARLRLRWKRVRYQLALRPATWRQAKGG